MSETPRPLPRLGLELESIRQWREEREASYQRDLAHIDEEDDRLHQKLAEIQRKLKDNAQLKEQALSLLHQLPLDVGRRSHNVLLDTLQADRELVAERTSALAAAGARHNVEVEARLADPDLGSQIREYLAFKDMQPLLETMPVSYRKVILDHHETLRARLEPVFQLVSDPPAPIEAPERALGLVCSVDPEEGTPSAFALLLPVEYEVYRDGASRREDLSSAFAYAVVGALSLSLRRVGAPNAPMAFRNYEGSLAIQIWLGNQKVEADLREVATGILEAGLDACPELRASRLLGRCVWVSPFTIAPDDELDLAAETPTAGAAPPADEGDIEADEADETVDGESPPRPVQIVLRRGGPEADDL